MDLLPRLRPHILVIIFLFAYFVLIATKLITQPTPFYDWDESIYAQVGREMVAKKSLVPLWQGEIWLDKPPLVPLFYGVVLAATPSIAPEVSLRLATLTLAIIVLAILYVIYYQVVKDALIATLVIAITSFTSIFLQRSQQANIDVFLLLGWSGYILFYKKRILAFVFLATAVMSKSLVGFYPVAIMGIYYFYLFLTKKIKKKELMAELKVMLVQSLTLLLWYVVMFVKYGNDFLYQHIYESHTKRVTASIESHFGKRTFYIDILFEELGKYVWVALIGAAVMIKQWHKKQIKNKEVLFATFLLPWFVFLNLAKTKIFWYGYPYVVQIVFLIVYPLILIKKYLPRFVYIGIVALIFFFVIKHYVFDMKVYANQYSSEEDHHLIAKYAEKECSNLYVLVDPATREASETLEKMNLLITTSRWWGNHPSMVYYFGKHINFIYDIESLDFILNNEDIEGCIVIAKEDEGLIQKNWFKSITFGSMSLYKLNK